MHITKLMPPLQLKETVSDLLLCCLMVKMRSMRGLGTYLLSSSTVVAGTVARARSKETVGGDSLLYPVDNVAVE